MTGGQAWNYSRRIRETYNSAPKWIKPQLTRLVDEAPAKSAVSPDASMRSEAKDITAAVAVSHPRCRSWP
jgi:hypothetical protein